MVATPAKTARQPRPRPDEGRGPEPEAIFICGASRSGTTLLRKILETSDRIAIAPENHFVGHVLPREGARFYFRRLGELADDDTIRSIVELIYSGEYQRRSRWREISPFWRWLIRDVPRAELEQRLLAAERTERGLMAAFMRIYADKHGRPVMGEKTPAHLAFTDTLLDWFPDGRVVHMLRDPRAVFVSDSHRRRGHPRRPYSWLMRVPLLFPAVMLLQTTFVWAGAARRHAALQRRHPGRYMLVRFEDLVQKPDEVLPALFEFLGVAMPARATEVEVVSRGFRVGEQGLDAGAATRWREHIHPFAERFLRLVLGRPMRRLGYRD